MSAATVLRAVAVVLAVFGVIDPAVMRSYRPPLEVDLAVPRDDAAATATASPDAANDEARRRLVRELNAAVGDDLRLRTREFGPGERLPCAADVPCVVVTDPVVAPRGGFGGSLERQRPLFTIAPVVAAGVPGVVTIDDVVVPPAQVDAFAAATVTLAADGAEGRATRIELRDGDVPAGALDYTWTRESPVTLPVPWWPVRAGRRVLSVTATTDGARGAAPQQARATAVVEVTATPWPVLVVEFRPSWAVTFVRRALEADARFAVDAHAVLAPGLVSARGRTGLDDQRVADARVVIAGGLDGLTERDVARLERFVAERGGALILVPDGVVSGPPTRLLPGRWRARLDGVPASVEGLRASEWLVASDLATGDLVLATHDDAPAIVSRAIGEGRVVVVGALDAWRRRSPAEPSLGASPYASFWRGLVADLARGTDSAVDVRIDHIPGDADAIVDVQARVMEPRTAWRASARLVCDDAETALRLWPRPRAGQFRGRVPLLPPGTTCEVVADVVGLGTGRAAVTTPVDTRVETRRIIARLQEIAAASGGTTAEPGDLTALAGALRALERPAPASAPSWPLRSWWWGLAAALALGGEWWLRRRAGAR